jgi:hypothetical protein
MYHDRQIQGGTHVANGSVRTWIGSLTSMILGAIIAAVTLVGLISSTLDSGGDHPASVDNATVPYGTTQ